MLSSPSLRAELRNYPARSTHPKPTTTRTNPRSYLRTWPTKVFVSRRNSSDVKRRRCVWSDLCSKWCLVVCINAQLREVELKVQRELSERRQELLAKVSGGALCQTRLISSYLHDRKRAFVTSRTALLNLQCNSNTNRSLHFSNTQATISICILGSSRDKG